MTAGVGVLGGMAIRGIVAAQRRAALLAGPQMNPPGADLDALFAFVALWRLDRINGIDMGTDFVFRHGTEPLWKSALTV